ncbi:hypothetical protein V502_10132 [Pseudogymnoascus sp. VKM F-4520 (FW-2644)]|nr:hypothetical protein V502_10132 [Pseudogymnoascus sp. VKM F-4520 (FW-2644)]
MLFRRSTQERERRGRAARSTEEDEYAAEGGDESFLDFWYVATPTGSMRLLEQKTNKQQHILRLPTPPNHPPKHPLLLRTLPPTRPPNLLTHNLPPLLPTPLALPLPNNALPPPTPHFAHHNRHSWSGHHPAPLAYAFFAEPLHTSHCTRVSEVDILGHREEGGEGSP